MHKVSASAIQREQAARKFRGTVADFVATFPDLAPRCSVRVKSPQGFGPLTYTYSVHVDRCEMRRTLNKGDNARRPVVAD